MDKKSHKEGDSPQQKESGGGIFAQNLQDFVQPAVETLGESAKEGKNILQQKASDVSTKTKQGLKTAKDTSKNVMDTVASETSNLSSKTKKGFQSAEETSKNIFDQVVSSAEEGARKVKDVGSDALNTVEKGLSTASSKTKDGIQSVKESSQNIADQLPKAKTDDISKNMSNVGENILSPVKTGLENIPSKTQQGVKKLEESSKSVLDKIPSGGSIAERIEADARKIKDSSVSALNTAGAELSSASSSAKEELQNLQENVTSKMPSVSSIGAETKEKIDKVKEDGASALDSLERNMEAAATEAKGEVKSLSDKSTSIFEKIPSGDEIKIKAEEGMKKIKDTGASAKHTIGTGISAASNKTKEGLQNLQESGAAFLEKIPFPGSSQMDDHSKNIKDISDSALNSLHSEAENISSKVIEKTDQLKESGKNIVQDFPAKEEKLKQEGSTALESIGSEVSKKTEEVTGLEHKNKSFFDKISPSEVATKTEEEIKKLKDSGANALTAIGTGLSVATSKAKEGIENIQDSSKHLFETLPTGISIFGKPEEQTHDIKHAGDIAVDIVPTIVDNVASKTKDEKNIDFNFPSIPSGTSQVAKADDLLQDMKDKGSTAMDTATEKLDDAALKTHEEAKQIKDSSKSIFDKIPSGSEIAAKAEEGLQTIKDTGSNALNTIGTGISTVSSKTKEGIQNLQEGSKALLDKFPSGSLFFGKEEEPTQDKIAMIKTSDGIQADLASVPSTLNKQIQSVQEGIGKEVESTSTKTEECSKSFLDKIPSGSEIATKAEEELQKLKDTGANALNSIGTGIGVVSSKVNEGIHDIQEKGKSILDKIPTGTSLLGKTEENTQSIKDTATDALDNIQTKTEKKLKDVKQTGNVVISATGTKIDDVVSEAKENEKQVQESGKNISEKIPSGSEIAAKAEVELQKLKDTGASALSSIGTGISAVSSKVNERIQDIQEKGKSILDKIPTGAALLGKTEDTTQDIKDSSTAAWNNAQVTAENKLHDIKEKGSTALGTAETKLDNVISKTNNEAKNIQEDNKTIFEKIPSGSEIAAKTEKGLKTVKDASASALHTIDTGIHIAAVKTKEEVQNLQESGKVLLDKIPSTPLFFGKDKESTKDSKNADMNLTGTTQADVKSQEESYDLQEKIEVQLNKLPSASSVAATAEEKLQNVKDKGGIVLESIERETKEISAKSKGGLKRLEDECKHVLDKIPSRNSVEEKAHENVQQVKEAATSATSALHSASAGIETASSKADDALQSLTESGKNLVSSFNIPTDSTTATSEPQSSKESYRSVINIIPIGIPAVSTDVNENKNVVSSKPSDVKPLEPSKPVFNVTPLDITFPKEKALDESPAKHVSSLEPHSNTVEKKVQELKDAASHTMDSIIEDTKNTAKDVQDKTKEVTDDIVDTLATKTSPTKISSFATSLVSPTSQQTTSQPPDFKPFFDIPLIPPVDVAPSVKKTPEPEKKADLDKQSTSEKPPKYPSEEKPKHMMTEAKPAASADDSKPPRLPERSPQFMHRDKSKQDKDPEDPSSEVKLNKRGSNASNFCRCQ